MKIGNQTRPWGPEKNRQSLPEVLAEIASVGYDGVGIGAQHLGIGRTEALRQQLIIRRAQRTFVILCLNPHQFKLNQQPPDRLDGERRHPRSGGRVDCSVADRCQRRDEGTDDRDDNAQAQSANEHGTVNYCVLRTA